MLEHFSVFFSQGTCFKEKPRDNKKNIKNKKTQMNELLKYGSHESSKGMFKFYPYEFNVMKMIGSLIDHVDMLKKLM